MNEYLINPSWFYWISVVDGLRGFFIVLGICSGAITISSILFFAEDLIDIKQWKKISIIGCIFILISILGAILLPSKETLIEMEVARLATKSNIDWTIESIKELIDYIVDAIKK